ncbi:hypothetical protein Q8A73_020416 [Channa argus]|nr:hypothetical protein Q8A73_020416 [Channa argus]
MREGCSYHLVFGSGGAYLPSNLSLSELLTISGTNCTHDSDCFTMKEQSLLCKTRSVVKMRKRRLADMTETSPIPSKPGDSRGCHRLELPRHVITFPVPLFLSGHRPEHDPIVPKHRALRRCTGDLYMMQPVACIPGSILCSGGEADSVRAEADKRGVKLLFPLKQWELRGDMQRCSHEWQGSGMCVGQWPGVSVQKPFPAPHNEPAQEAGSGPAVGEKGVKEGRERGKVVGEEKEKETSSCRRSKFQHLDSGGTLKKLEPDCGSCGQCSTQSADGNTRPSRAGFGVIIKAYRGHVFHSSGYAFTLSEVGFLLFSTPDDSKDKRGYNRLHSTEPI